MENPRTWRAAATRRRRRSVLAALLALPAVAAVAWLLLRPDPEEAVTAVEVDQVQVPAPASTASSGPQQVEALEELTGPLRRGDEATDFLLDNADLDFGPDVWMRTAGPSQDFDADGTAENLLAELDGLVGQQVTAQVRFDSDGDAAVFLLNGLLYRDSAGGTPPWQPSPPSGSPASRATVRAAAVAAIAPKARVTDLERLRVGTVAWEATVLDRQGREYSVLLDAQARVLNRRRD